MVRRGVSVDEAATAAGVPHATAYRIIQQPRVTKYIDSLRRWYAYRAAEGRLADDLESDT